MLVPEINNCSDATNLTTATCDNCAENGTAANSTACNCTTASTACSSNTSITYISMDIPLQNTTNATCSQDALWEMHFTHVDVRCYHRMPIYCVISVTFYFYVLVFIVILRFSLLFMTQVLLSTYQFL